MEESSLRIREFDYVPTAEEFVSQIEPKNIPAVFRGCIKDWKALSLWNPSDGGLNHLQGRVGSSAVEAMLSRSAPVFYGDIRSHERVPLQFSTFVRYCKDLLHGKDEVQDTLCDSKNQGPTRPHCEQSDSLFDEVPHQIYLAQVPIMNMDKEEEVQLEHLRDDIRTPAFLRTKGLASVNLWMNNAQSRSSTHYDPHNNLLCIVAGFKQVVLWPPSATPALYPLPLYGEASNHSAISLEKPNICVYPRAKSLTECSQKTVLHPGDALFIPEGWFHQVDSGSLTIAVNFWWRSEMMLSMSEHMDAYYLRRILKRLTDKEMDRMLCYPSSASNEIVTSASSQCGNECSDRSDHNLDSSFGHQNSIANGKWKFWLHELEPVALQSLHKLISLVHNLVNQNQPLEPALTDTSVEENVETKKVKCTDLFKLEDDPVANIIWALQPRNLHDIFLVMAHNFPRTLEALILHTLSPIGAEVITRKFEEMDQLISEEERNEFYRVVYGVFDDQSAAMDTLLNGKESFAHQAFNNVLDQYLGVTLDGSKPSVDRGSKRELP